MGLDSYVIRIIKPEPLNEEVVSESELHCCGLNYVRTADLKPAMFHDLIPYSLQARLLTPTLDMERLRKEYGDEIENADRIFRFDGSLDLHFPGYEPIRISAEDLDKRFKVYKEMPALLFFSEEVAYWRKNYGVQKFFYEHISGIENTGFYMINEEVLKRYNELSDQNNWYGLPMEAPSEYTALFYHEWY